MAFALLCDHHWSLPSTLRLRRRAVSEAHRPISAIAKLQTHVTISNIQIAVLVPLVIFVRAVTLVAELAQIYAITEMQIKAMCARDQAPILVVGIRPTTARAAVPIRALAGRQTSVIPLRRTNAPMVRLIHATATVKTFATPLRRIPALVKFPKIIRPALRQIRTYILPEQLRWFC